MNERGNFPFLLFLFPCLSSSLPTRSIRGNFSHMTCNDYKLQSTLIQQESEEKVGNKFENTFPFYPRGGRSVSVGEIGGHNTYEAGIIHRIGAKCLFTSSFELSKLGTISDLRLGSRQVPRVRSVIYVSPSPKRDAPPPQRPTTIQPTFKPLLPTKHTYPSILITTPDSPVDWIGDLFVHSARLFDF